MRKLIKVVFFSLFLFLLFGISSSAVGEEEEFKDRFDEIIPDGFEWLADDDELLSGLGIDSLLNELFLAFSEGRGEFLSFFALVFGVCLLICAVECAPFFDSGALGKHISAGINTVSALAIFYSLDALSRSVVESIGETGSFFSALIPIMTGILAAGGNVSTAGIQAVNMNITFGVIGWVVSKLLLPLSFALFALALIDGFAGGAVSAVAKGVKSFFNWVLGIGTTVILACISMQSILASASDGAYLRAARYAAGGMIPMVGSVIASSLSALAGGLEYVKSTVGVASVVIIVCGALVPLLSLLLRRWAFSVSITFMEFLGVSGGVRCFPAFRSALDTLISVYSLSVLLYICEIIIFMKSGVSVFA